MKVEDLLSTLKYFNSNAHIRTKWLLPQDENKIALAYKIEEDEDERVVYLYFAVQDVTKEQPLQKAMTVSILIGKLMSMEPCTQIRTKCDYPLFEDNTIISAVQVEEDIPVVYLNLTIEYYTKRPQMGGDEVD